MTGRCPNLGNCAKADERVPIPVGDEADARCPECGSELVLNRDSGRKSSAGPLLALIALLLLGGIGWAAYQFMRPAAKSPVPAVTPTPIPSPTPTPTPVPTPTPSLEPKVALRLYGSSTVGDTLIPALAEVFLRQEHAEHIEKIVGNEPGAARVQGTLPGDTVPEVIEIVPESTAAALSDLAVQRDDVALASREVNADEARRLAEAGCGDMHSKEQEHIFALDALAVIVHPGNPVAELSKEQLAQIVKGQITSWSQVRGAVGPIEPCLPAEGTDEAEALRSLVLGGTAPGGASRTFRSGGEISEYVSTHPAAVGVVELPAVGNAKPLSISAGGSAPLLPNHFDIATEDYALSRRLYLYTSAKSSSPLADRFVEFALARAGQEVVERTGFVSLRPRVGPPKLRADAPEEYKKLAKDADRLDVNFRFQTASSQLDNKALLDLDLVADLLNRPPYAGRFILLFGFADSTGTEPVNKKLSQDRAEAVSKQLQSRGLKPAVVVGFGKELPVDTNDTEQGRSKNRRVEVWLRQ